VEGIQELWQWRASTSKAWFLVVIKAMAMSFGGKHLKCLVVYECKS
jgi:hypothetical protein